MQKILFILILIFILNNKIYCYENIDFDKIEHYKVWKFGSFLTTLALYNLDVSKDNDLYYLKKHPVVSSSLIWGIGGVAKELYLDSKFDFLDVVADIAGIISGQSLFLFIDKKNKSTNIFLIKTIKF